MGEEQRHTQASQRAQERAARIRARESERTTYARPQNAASRSSARTQGSSARAQGASVRNAARPANASSRDAARARSAARKREAEYRRNASTGRRYLVLIGAIVVAALLMVGLTVGSCAVRGCNGPGANAGNQATNNTTVPAATNGGSESGAAAGSGTAAPSLTEASTETDSMGLPAETPDPSKLGSVLESEYATALADTAAKNADAAWLMNHSDQLYADGDMVAYKLLKLAAMEPKACGFVRCWPEKHGKVKTSEPLTEADAPAEGRIAPLLLQWDPRWGYLTYSSTSFAVTGCGCACMAMVADGLTGTLDYTPGTMAKDAEKGGFMTEFNGTSDGFFDSEASKLGLTCRNIGTSKDELADAMSSGQIAIINVGPGDFTTGGHYIVACGITDANRLVVNDPYSITRSEQLWEINKVLQQAVNVWVFSK